MSSMIKSRVVATDRSDIFPYIGMRVLGSIQICIGVLVFVLGMVDLILSLMSYESDLENYGSRYGLALTLTVASCPLWCGLWFTVAGILGTCMTRDRAHSLQYFKAGFLILNILCSALFAPICAAITGFTSYARHDLDLDNFLWLLTLTICLLTVLEAAIATVSVTITCCCSTLRSAQVHVIVNPRDLTGQGNESIGDRKFSNVSRETQVNSDDVVNSNNRNSFDNSNGSKNLLGLPMSERNKINNKHEMQHNVVEVIKSSGYNPRRHPRIEIHEPIKDNFKVTSKCNKCNHWTVYPS